MQIEDCRLQISEFYELPILNVVADKGLTKAAKLQRATCLNLQSTIYNPPSPIPHL